nr:hypothetical protein [Paraburkholderia bannensis]
MAISATIKTAAVMAIFLRVNFMGSIALKLNNGLVLRRCASLGGEN